MRLDITWKRRYSRNDDYDLELSALFGGRDDALCESCTNLVLDGVASLSRGDTTCQRNPARDSHTGKRSVSVGEDDRPLTKLVLNVYTMVGFPNQTDVCLWKLVRRISSVRCDPRWILSSNNVP